MNTPLFSARRHTQPARQKLPVDLIASRNPSTWQLASSWILFYLLCCGGFHPLLQAQDPVSGVRYMATEKQRWEIGVTIQSPGNCTGITAAITVPKEWPEQAVTILKQEKSPQVRTVRFQTLSNDVQQMIVFIPRLAAGQQARVLTTFEVTKSHILAPTKTDQLRTAGQLPRSFQKYLLPSPFIESRDSRIQRLAGQIIIDKATDWEKVEAMFDWVRDNIQYKFDPPVARRHHGPGKKAGGLRRNDFPLCCLVSCQQDPRAFGLDTRALLSRVLPPGSRRNWPLVSLSGSWHPGFRQHARKPSYSPKGR